MKTPAWRSELARIVKILNRNDDETANLWFVLTALRGPDIKDDYPSPIKRAITGVLRHQVGLVPLSHAFVNEQDTKEHAAFRAEHSNNEHFYYHARDAFRVLGLSWGVVNPEPKPVRKTYKVARKKKAR